MDYGSEDSIFKIQEYKNEGKGLAFKHNITTVDDVIAAEYPVIAYKHRFSKLTTLSCDYCFKCVGSLNDYINHLCEIYPKLKCHAIRSIIFDTKLSDFINCARGCGNIYCSSFCYQKSIDNGHDVICKMDDISKRYWDEFERYSMGISETFIFAGLIVVQILHKYVNQNCELKDQMNYYLEFYNRPWHEIKQIEKCKSEECIGIALTLLTKSLSEYTNTNRINVDEILSSKFYSKIMGMIELVAIDIEVESGHNELIFSNIKNVDKNAWKQLLTLKELMDGLDHSTLMDYDTQQYIQKFGDEIIPDTLGLGIFNTFSRMNHSCMPNLEVNYHNNFLARAKLLSAVSSGDQAYISYIDEQLPTRYRKRLLSKYLFKCKCKKCINYD
ncbi:Histone-lysine N-methyltransferase ATXR2 [Babesia microti strain RI]|uniref:Histone-lysine N-methyltransferase ATXR2 n=1 Tax=Babesia microti (strain RI) TaxID=1133968 RepID=A0A1R4AAA8_BABMR|nr:Histone-lysine N-methyltransferase ATXR2 [Babesia microti strain RI]SJK85930.1 Histone-lysine N-methyltransferase ATXR2 [Babesia microti strain RI]|eukprot:XP_021338137.1 Histone-lysine N-methyltransferase ATXR2 [Babesia microti strain RI]